MRVRECEDVKVKCMWEGKMDKSEERQKGRKEWGIIWTFIFLSFSLLFLPFLSSFLFQNFQVKEIFKHTVKLWVDCQSIPQQDILQHHHLTRRGHFTTFHKHEQSVKLSIMEINMDVLSFIQMDWFWEQEQETRFAYGMSRIAPVLLRFQEDATQRACHFQRMGLATFLFFFFLNFSFLEFFSLFFFLELFGSGGVEKKWSYFALVVVLGCSFWFSFHGSFSLSFFLACLRLIDWLTCDNFCNRYYLAVGSDDGNVRLWDLRKLTNLTTLNIGSSVNHVSFDKSGVYLAVASDDVRFEVWHLFFLFFSDHNRATKFNQRKKEKSERGREELNSVTFLTCVCVCDSKTIFLFVWFDEKAFCLDKQFLWIYFCVDKINQSINDSIDFQSFLV